MGSKTKSAEVAKLRREVQRLQNENNRYVEVNKEQSSTIRRLTLENRKLKKQSLTDHLTGISNRRAFDSDLLEMIGAACRIHNFVTVVYFDVDNFKLLNDVLGHAAGDTALRIVAKKMKQVFQRRTDKIFRTGGDEFAVICLASSMEEVEPLAVSLTEKLEHAIRSYDHVFATCGIVVAASYGIASYFGVSVRDASYEAIAATLKQEADERMYQYKQQKKIGVVVPH